MIYELKSDFTKKFVFRFQNGAVPGSINLPYQTCWTTDGTLIPCVEVEQLDRARGKIVCVIGSSCNDLGLKFSEILSPSNPGFYSIY